MATLSSIGSCSFVTTIVVLALSASVQAQEREKSHERMIQTLEEIANQVDSTHKYVGDGILVAAQEKWDAEKGKPRTAEHWALALGMAKRHLMLGNEEKAIKSFDTAVGIGMGLRLPAKQGLQTVFARAVGYLRLGETENCCTLNHPESCIFPIRPAAVHEKERGSRLAIKDLELCLGVFPPKSKKYREARWLLNIAYMTLGEYPDKVPKQYVIPESRLRSKEPFPRFPNVAKESGLNTFDLSGGAVTEDFDRDGDLDLMITKWHPAAQVDLLVNDGEGKFSNATSTAGLDGIVGGLNMVQADFNNDGFEDVFILRGAWLGKDGRHPNSLLRNNGDGTFTDITFLAGLAEPAWPTQTAAWGDYDLDGDLDLYIGNETEKLTSPCQLFRNNGDETFTDVAEAAGVTNMRFTKGVVWGDYDGDRWPDIYVSNLFSENRLYRNRGDGTFEDVAQQLKVTAPNPGFPVWFWDFDNDGQLDLFASAYHAEINDVLDYFVGDTVHSERARLYRGTGDGFEEVGVSANLVRPCNPMGANFGDLNNDGFPDFYLGTGTPPFSQLMPNVMYLNKGGQRFADVTTAGGFGNLQKGHAIAFVDFDQDGDQDVFEQMGGAFLGDKYYDVLYENPGFGNNWVSIRLVGRESNRSAIGARIKAVIKEEGVQRSVFQHVNSGGSFGCKSLTQMIGLGKAKVIERLEVYWPKTDSTQVFAQVPVNSRLTIEEGRKDFTTAKPK